MDWTQCLLLLHAPQFSLPLQLSIAQEIPEISRSQGKSLNKQVYV